MAQIKKTAVECSRKNSNDQIIKQLGVFLIRISCRKGRSDVHRPFQESDRSFTNFRRPPSALSGDVDELTDEEDIDEDAMGETSVQDVPGSLEVHVDRVPVEEHAKNKEKSTTSSRKKRKFCDSEPIWKHKTPEYSNVKERSVHHSECLKKMKESQDNLSPLELFEKLMTPSIYDHIV
ncbi:hypothetical protein Pcinc_022566 [Petrolisthes cinctipes]|uniref:Uncharacterized protein n=1 Tax=Petrolisthes cinctipes TaxID=88211 RepID=A0AAE1KFQ1_PETCI|nr:hypothetical protein Pcinc_022566 [Petrolisthes cinctipes]